MANYWRIYYDNNLIKINLEMKNIISNIVGVILIFASTYFFLVYSLDLIKYGVVVVIGLSCFYFDNYTIKKYISKALDKILK